MKALIIGVSGFVGEYLAEELFNNNVEVYGADIAEGLDNKYVKFLKLNLLCKEEIIKVLEELKPDYIINLAAISSVKYSWEEPALTFDVNVKGVINIFEVVRKLEIKSRILLIGSSEEYGAIGNNISINEEMPLNALNPYGISKITQETIALMYKKTYGVDVIMVRAFNHIGPKQKLGFVIPDFSSQIVKIEKHNIKAEMYVGNLKAERDFTDVRDIVRAYRLLLEKGISGEVYNVGSGTVHSIESLLNKLISKSIKNIEVKIDKERFRPIDTPKIVCDNRKIKEHIGWKPEIDIDKTLEDILKYWRNNA